MSGPINRLVFLIVNPLDDVSLLANPAVRKNGVRGSETFEVRLERTNINGRTARNVFAEVESGRDFLHRIKAGELADSHAHGIARIDQTIGARLNAAISAIGISRRPISGAVDFTGLNRVVANRGTRQETVGKSDRVKKGLES